ncbi:MAG: Hsp20/alpha crystallin family protein [Burkholderiaceae bacterium]|nr:Hsp20/alpha crystallin family protein [Burkholderiaceae bacterium]MDZ4146323.1 Hsp20/alpha crystallin family protein [Burkholderiales bacterium]
MYFTPTAVVRRSAYVPALRSLDRFLGEALSVGTAPAAQAGVSQDEKTVTLTFDVPGVAKDQLTIGIEANIVRIETVADAPRRYKMAYELPQDIDVAASEARLENGVLTLKLVRQAPVDRAVRLNIN